HLTPRPLALAVVLRVAEGQLHRNRLLGSMIDCGRSGRIVQSFLKFETGHYSRAWEISKSHLTEEANQYLEELADSPTPLGLLFEVFRIPDGHCIGVKLVSTPWTDRNLELIDGRSSVELLQEQQSAGVPELLLEVLHLASRADTRFLVFDPDAPLLAGLPVIVD
ncbi:ABC transporter substrate-binding protein, partial [Xanthomonas phaseoli]|uniref:DUF5983 family protein n=1 Tax=Xanthomonas phaseoli TaxID=1985254 RepID=UPI0013649A01